MRRHGVLPVSVYGVCGMHGRLTMHKLRHSKRSLSCVPRVLRHDCLLIFWKTEKKLLPICCTFDETSDGLGENGQRQSTQRHIQSSSGLDTLIVVLFVRLI